MLCTTIGQPSPDGQIALLELENQRLRNELKKLTAEHEKIVQWQDLTVRALHNKNISPVYCKLYLALMDRYPELLDGQRVAVELWRVREDAGWASKASATKFVQDMKEIKAISYYDPGKFDEDEERRTGYLQCDPDIFPYPEVFDTKACENRRKARAAQAKERDTFRQTLTINQCEMCGSEELEFDLIARCKSCQHEHDPIRGIAKEAISVVEIYEKADEEMEVVELTGEIVEEEVLPDFLLEPEQLHLAEPKPAEPPMPDMTCKRCGKSRRECWKPTTNGLWTISCEDGKEHKHVSRANTFERSIGT